MLEFRFVDIHAEGNDAGAGFANLLQQRPVAAPEIDDRPGVAERRHCHLHDRPMGFVHCRARAEPVVARIPLRGRRVRRDWRLESLAEGQRMRHAWSLRRSKREAEAGHRLGGETTAMPADDELVRGRIGARRGLEHGVFTSAIPCSADQDTGQLRISSSQSISAPCPTLTAERHEHVGEGHRGVATEGAWQVGHGARTHPPPENVGLKRRVGVDLDQPAGVVHASAVGRHRPRGVDATLVHPRLAEEGDAAVGKPQQTSHRPIVAGVDRALQLGDIGERSYGNPIFEGLPDARGDGRAGVAGRRARHRDRHRAQAPGGPLHAPGYQLLRRHRRQRAPANPGCRRSAIRSPPRRCQSA